MPNFRKWRSWAGPGVAPRRGGYFLRNHRVRPVGDGATTRPRPALLLPAHSCRSSPSSGERRIRRPWHALGWGRCHPGPCSPSTATRCCTAASTRPPAAGSAPRTAGRCGPSAGCSPSWSRRSTGSARTPSSWASTTGPPACASSGGRPTRRTATPSRSRWRSSWTRRSTCSARSASWSRCRRGWRPTTCWPARPPTRRPSARAPWSPPPTGTPSRSSASTPRCSGSSTGASTPPRCSTRNDW